jgi:hypothetical protein
MKWSGLSRRGLPIGLCALIVVLVGVSVAVA